MKKSCVIDFEKCSPHTHDGGHGLCDAAIACPKKLIEQEDPFDAPFLMSKAMCTGCGKCASACSLHAVTIKTG